MKSEQFIAPGARPMTSAKPVREQFWPFWAKKRQVIFLTQKKNFLYFVEKPLGGVRELQKTAKQHVSDGF